MDTIVNTKYPDLIFRSIPDAFFKRARANSMKAFEIFKYRGSWVKRSFREAGHKILSIAGSLKRAGIKKGDKVAILSQTRSEWTICDLAIQTAGAVTIPIYPNVTPDTVSFILENSESCLLFVEKLKAVKNVKIPSSVKAIVAFEHDKDEHSKPGAENVILLSEFEKQGEDLHDKVDVDEVSIDDLATIVYTSGTTGIPKGVMLTHGNILSMVDGATQIIVPREDDIIFAWLPFAHIFGRLIIFYAVYNAVTIAYSEGIAKILENIKEVRPTLFPSVPRIYEKAYERIKSRASQTPIRKKIFEFAEKIGGIYADYMRDKEVPPPHVSLLYKLADLLVFSKIREAFGGRIRLCISGGASIPPHIARFFTSAGILLLEGYGMTETASVVTVNRPEKFKFGSIGIPIPHVHVKIAEDGELLIKSPSTTPGYYKLEDETGKLYTDDGWLKTGDIVEVDEEGFLFFKGRKKNIIVTSFGKNIAPEPIEIDIQKDPMIDSVAIFGDERPYLVALISLNREEVMRFASEKGIKGDYKDVVMSDQVRNYISSVIDKVNSGRPSYERIHKFRIVPDEWSAETGELTPTLKVKRYLLYQRYRSIIDEMYSD